MEYDASVTLNVYTLALPIADPESPFLLLYNEIGYLSLGAPAALLTLKIFPISNGIFTLDTFLVSLGFATSRMVVPILTTSYPFTYDFPGDTFTHIKSSDGVLSSSVFSSLKKIPLFPNLSFNEL